MKIFTAEFLVSAVSPAQYPRQPLPEVAFAGRSNVGKSSLINTLVHRKNLVKTSATPGKTQAINFFVVNQRFLPNRILLLADGAQGQKQLGQWLPFVHSIARKQGRATAYICENYICKLPTADPLMVARLLDGKL